MLLDFLISSSLYSTGSRTEWRRAKLSSKRSSHTPGLRSPLLYFSLTRPTSSKRRSCILTFLHTFLDLQVSLAQTNHEESRCLWCRTPELPLVETQLFCITFSYSVMKSPKTIGTNSASRQLSISALSKSMQTY